MRTLKLKKEGNDRYNTWRKDRKGKKDGRVTIMIKSTIKVTKVEYGKGKEELWPEMKKHRK